jgi:endonuclease G
MKSLISIFLFFFTTNCFSQVDTIINSGFYKSYFDYEVKQPLYVTYKLFKGGGDCSRASFRFRNDTKIQTSNFYDYDKSGYDMGHLVNAADFAFNCEMGEKTFRYYNCLPQTPNLNRGVWKSWETKIRKESQTDSLLIICGGVFGKKRIKKNSNVFVPDNCWKIVYSLSKGEVLNCLWFTNSKKAKVIELSFEDIIKRIPYEVKLTY